MANFNFMVNLKFERILFNEGISGSLPEMVINVETPEGDRIDTFYLTFFRGYASQVSGRHGSGDYGSTRANFFSDYAGSSALGISEILRTMASDAIRSFENSGMLEFVVKDYYRDHGTDISKDDTVTIYTKTDSCKFDWGAIKRPFIRLVREAFTREFPDKEWPFATYDDTLDEFDNADKAYQKERESK